MVIANACGHPDCANAAEMLTSAHEDLARANAEIAEYRKTIEHLEKSLHAFIARASDWHKLADQRSAEIIRLLGENGRLTDEIQALQDELAKGGKS